MRLEQLQYLVEISRTHSFRVAAESLYVTQPAISEGIKKLEVELDVLLLNRTQSGAYLTEIGEETTAIAKRVLRDVALIESRVKAKRYSDVLFEQELRIYSRPAINSCYMAQMISILRERQPKLRLTIFERNVYDLLNAIDEEVCDMGILVLKESHMLRWRQNATWVSQRIMPVQLYLVVHADGYPPEKQKVTLQEISGMSLAMHSADDGDFSVIDDTIFGKIKKPQILFRSDNIELIYQCVVQENLRTILNGLRIKNLPETLRAIPIVDVDDLYMWYIYQERDQQTQLLEYIRELLNHEVFHLY